MKRNSSPVAEVHHDQNRHTCIVVERGAGLVGYIKMSLVDVKVERSSEANFAHDYQPLDDYTPDRAARRYLDGFAELKIQVSPEAMAHLERIAGPAYKRVRLVDEDPAPTPKPTLKKEPEMSKPEKASPAKKPAPVAKKAPTAAPEKKAPAAPTKMSSKPEAAPAEAKRGRQPGIAGTAKIKILAPSNPKRAAAAERFALYKNGMTVDEYIAAGGTRADVNWDVKQAFIEVK